MGTKKGQVSYSAPLQPRYPCSGQGLGDWEGAGRVGLTRLQKYCFFPNWQGFFGKIISSKT
jgi:hypothetical protein